MTALRISEYILYRCTQIEKSISNLKLQKILYLLYGEYYKETKQKLFEDSFVAWKLGPVILDVYFFYYDNAAKPIIVDKTDGIDDVNIDFINYTIDKYCLFSTWDLIALSQNKAWKKAYKNGEGVNCIIPHQQIISCFTK